MLKGKYKRSNRWAFHQCNLLGYHWSNNFFFFFDTLEKLCMSSKIYWPGSVLPVLVSGKVRPGRMGRHLQQSLDVVWRGAQHLLGPQEGSAAPTRARFSSQLVVLALYHFKRTRPETIEFQRQSVLSLTDKAGNYRVLMTVCTVINRQLSLNLVKTCWRVQWWDLNNFFTN